MDSANPKVYVVTNVTSVLGKAIALGLAMTDATNIIVAKDQSHGAGVVQEISMGSQNPRVELQLGDLSNLSSVRNLAEVINSKYERIDGLILNNTVYRKQRSMTVDGFEEMFAANYLGSFLLTNLLLDRLRAGVVGQTRQGFRHLELDAGQRQDIRIHAGLGKARSAQNKRQRRCQSRHRDHYSETDLLRLAPWVRQKSQSTTMGPCG